MGADLCVRFIRPWYEHSRFWESRSKHFRSPGYQRLGRVENFPGHMNYTRRKSRMFTSIPLHSFNSEEDGARSMHQSGLRQLFLLGRKNRKTAKHSIKDILKTSSILFCIGPLGPEWIYQQLLSCWTKHEVVRKPRAWYLQTLCLYISRVRRSIRWWYPKLKKKLSATLIWTGLATFQTINLHELSLWQTGITFMFRKCQK